MEPLLKSILTEEALKQMADPTFGVTPPNAVAKGDTWKKESTLNLGPIGSYKGKYTYKYEGQDEKNKDLAKISVETEARPTSNRLPTPAAPWLAVPASTGIEPEEQERQGHGVLRHQEGPARKVGAEDRSLRRQAQDRDRRHGNRSDADADARYDRQHQRHAAGKEADLETDWPMASLLQTGRPATMLGVAIRPARFISRGSRAAIHSSAP